MAQIVDPKAQRTAVVAGIRARLRHDNDARAVLQWLEDDHDFIWYRSTTPERLRGLGVTCTCTAGPHGLLTNWCVAVERKDGGPDA